ncbi:MAG: hypothetical protein F6K41_21515 [Symploca sp. SIO3E6]|nr:hypothetical protein [Caldora sp. SIO3E6]
MTKINLGSNSTKSEGWLNFDLTSGNGVDLVGDSRYLWFVGEDMPEAIRASHLLEHFPPCEILSILKLWHVALKPGGTLIIGVPDFDYMLREFRKEPMKFLSFWKDHERLLFVTLYGSYYPFRDDSNNLPFRHRVIFTEESLTAILTDAGFTNVQRFHPKSVAENHGFDDVMRLPLSLNVKCEKPL